MIRLQHFNAGITALRLHCRREFHGTEYGGWTLCANRLSEKALVYSLGVGEDISFDLSLIEKYGVTVFAFDPTPRSIAWVKAQELPPQFNLVEYGVANYDGTATFFPPENPAHISHTLLTRTATQERRIQVEVRRLKTLMRELQHQSIDILKMDIEGSEYDVIDDIIASNILPQQLLVEFHDRFEGVGIEKNHRAIRQLSAVGYKLVHRSAQGTEYTFLKA